MANNSKIVVGALAHVDAGKTTLAEAILYKTSSIRKIGRVDHKDAYLDFNSLEKEKGITIFNKEAHFTYKDKEYIYVDTPGHNDFAYESNRAIKVLDLAILIVSAIEDVPSTTIKQFNNLINNNIPIIIFVNKMDITSFTKEEIVNKLKNKLSDDCVTLEDLDEHVALNDEKLLDEYLNSGSVDKKYISKAIEYNEIFPVVFGSALKDECVDTLLDTINSYINVSYETSELNAYIYKVSKDYSYLKILGGTLNNKDSFGEYKINEMYLPDGDNFKAVSSVAAGEIVAVKGLKDLPIGTYLPSFEIYKQFELPSLTYRIISNLETNELYKKLETISNEFPELKIRLEEGNIFINLNGELHSLIVKNTIKERLEVDVEFSSPIIRYKETINEEVYGVGHFEPLRHYGEVIVKVSPYDDGIKINSLIDNSYVNTLIAYLRNYPIRGILTNSYLTNVQITIVDIKTHPKHTEGGDLIQCVRRAIRHALSKTTSKLLEPFYVTSIATSPDTINPIISSLGNLKYEVLEDSLMVLIPLVSFNETLLNLKSKLKGNINYSIDETIYLDCLNADEVIEKRHYDYRSDTRNPAGSVFCKSGAGHYVEPEEVEANMHLKLSDYIKTISVESVSHNKSTINDDELKRVWNSIYKPKPRYIPKQCSSNEERIYKPTSSKPLIYLVDGYNLMYRVDEELAMSDIINGREKVINLVCDFAGYVSAKVVLVFDAYKVNDSRIEIIDRDNITIVYTKKGQTADAYIELKSKELKDDYKVIVVSSDNLERIGAYYFDASLISSDEFLIRYNNFKKNNTYIKDNFSNKPFEKLKELLATEEE